MLCCPKSMVGLGRFETSISWIRRLVVPYLDGCMRRLVRALKSSDSLVEKWSEMTAVSFLQALQHPISTGYDSSTKRCTTIASVLHRPSGISEMRCVIHGHLFSGIDIPPSRQRRIARNPQARVAGMVEEIILAERMIGRISEPQFLIYLHQRTIVRLPRSNIFFGEEGSTEHYDNLVNSERLGGNEPFAVNRRLS